LSGRLRITLPRSEPVRFVLLSLVLVLVVVAPVLWFVYHRADALLHNRIISRIEDREANLLLGYRIGGVPGLIRSIENEIETGIVHGGVILLVDPAGRKIAGNVPSWPPTLHNGTTWREMRLYADNRTSAQLYAIRSLEFPSQHRLLLGTNLEDRERMREALAEALLGALLLAIPAGIAAGLILLRFTDRRVKTIGDLANRIAAGDLSQRLETGGESEAYARLARAVNAMLARMEELVEQLRLVTDALAHDLRSPLTRMRCSVEKAASECEDPKAQQALADISGQIDSIMRLISATLEISRTEAGIGRENFSRFDLGGLLTDLCEIYHPLAEENGIEIEVDEPGTVEFLGNRELIGQAVSNLVENAMKYASSGGSIRLRLDEDEDEIRLIVADRGPGIPERKREEALAKYGRLEQARTSDGSGLGLALVRAAARLHGGDLELEDNAPGLRVVMRQPRRMDH
jgi:signal transduction histidine kinase